VSGCECKIPNFEEWDIIFFAMINRTAYTEATIWHYKNDKKGNVVIFKSIFGLQGLEKFIYFHTGNTRGTMRCIMN